MHKIRVSHIRAGQSFDQALFLPSGQKLIGAHVPLNERHVEALRRCGSTELCLAASVEELLAHGEVQRSESQITVGQKADRDILSATGNVVVEAGETVEEHHIDALEAGGGSFEADPAADRRERILMADALVEELEAKIPELTMRVPPATENTWVQPASADTWPSPDQLAHFRHEQVQRIRQLYAKAEAGVGGSVDEIEPVVDALLDRLARHPTRFTQLALMCQGREDYLPDHAFTATVLAMSIALNLRWSRSDVKAIGLAGLVYDLGMLLVAERIRIGACELTDIDRGRVQRHPIFSVSLIQTIRGVPPVIQLAALQHHERENGSGYPRGRRKNAICDYARVLAVADAYAARTEPRHYRKPKLPYVSMEETLRGASTLTKWPPAVKALVQSAGLFPVGSFVKLSTGENAQVVQAHTQQLDRPVVRLLDHEGNDTPKVVDLSEVSKQSLAVVRAVATAKG